MEKEIKHDGEMIWLPWADSEPQLNTRYRQLD